MMAQLQIMGIGCLEAGFDTFLKVLDLVKAE